MRLPLVEALEMEQTGRRCATVRGYQGVQALSDLSAERRLATQDTEFRLSATVGALTRIPDQLARDSAFDMIAVEKNRLERLLLESIYGDIRRGLMNLFDPLMRGEEQEVREGIDRLIFLCEGKDV